MLDTFKEHYYLIYPDSDVEGILTELHGQIKDNGKIAFRIWETFYDIFRTDPKMYTDDIEVGVRFEELKKVPKDFWIKSGTVRFKVRTDSNRNAVSTINKIIPRVVNSKLEDVEITVILPPKLASKSGETVELLNHEFIHLYNILQKDLLKGKSPEIPNNYRTSVQLLNQSIDKCKQDLGKIEYILNKSEQNAVIGELYSELRDLYDTYDISYNLKAEEAVKQTEGAKKLKSAWEALERLKECPKENVEQAFQELHKNPNRTGSGRHSTVTSILDSLEERLGIFDRRFNQVAGKVCYDLVSEVMMEIIGDPGTRPRFADLVLEGQITSDDRVNLIFRERRYSLIREQKRKAIRRNESQGTD